MTPTQISPSIERWKWENDGITPAQAAKEILRRRAMRSDLTAFCTHALVPEGLAPAAHHKLLLSRLQDVACGKIRKLMINMPPGSAKSTYASRFFPAWFMAQKVQSHILAASHTTGLAETFSRKVQSVIRDNRVELAISLKSENVEQWETSNRSVYRSAGVGTGIAGFRADLGLIDDPIRTRAEADSETIRERIWEWYKADFHTRLKPDSRQIIIMTRWHEDDLGGRLLATEPDEWDVVCLRAVAGDNDPFGRAPGEMLWSDDEYGYGEQLKKTLAFYERTGGMRDWSALYQQDPRPLEGALFKIHNIPVIEAAPAGGVKVRAWDLAATEQTGTHDPDWTVGVLMTRHADGRFTVLDVKRLRGHPEEVERAIVNTAAQDGRGVAVSIPQDPGQAGKAQVAYLTRKLTGYNVHSNPETGDKATRAAPVAAQCNVGNVSVVDAPWTKTFIEELRGFPSGVKDDQVDALSRAFAMLVDRAPFALDPSAVNDYLASLRRR